MKLQALKQWHVYYLDDFTAPKVFNGLCFECTISNQCIAANEKAVKDLGHVEDYAGDIFKPKRFHL